MLTKQSILGTLGGEYVEPPPGREKGDRRCSPKKERAGQGSDSRRGERLSAGALQTKEIALRASERQGETCGSR